MLIYRSKTVFLVLVILLTIPLASSYNTILYDDNLDQNFRVTGLIISNSDNTTDVNIKYNISLNHRYFNKSDINSFRIVLQDGEEELFQKDIGEFSLNTTERKSNFIEITSENPPDRVDNILFEVNHTGHNPEDGREIRLASNQLEYTLNEINPEIQSVILENKTVRRGKNITLTTITKDIDSLKVNGNQMEATEKGFNGEIPIPGDIKGSNHQLTLDFKTDRGVTFQRKINVTPQNSAPEIKVSELNLTEGEKAEIQVEASDDTGVNRTYLNFQEANYTVEDGTVSLPTENLSNGTYSFKAVSIDFEGFKTTIKRNLSVNPEEKEKIEDKNKGGEQQENQDEEGKEEPEEDEEPANSTEKPKSFPEVIIDPLINWLKSLL